MKWPLLLALAACGRIDMGPTHFEYVASVADCLDPNTPDLTSCQTRKGITELVIDGKDSMTMMPWYAFLRFELDAQLDGASITRLELRAVATDDADTPANMAGEIWQVSTFTEADLATTVPTKLAALAADPGPVVKLQVVQWSLPVTVAKPRTPLCLGIFPTTNDGVHYWNLLGADPPRLIVDTQ